MTTTETHALDRLHDDARDMTTAEKHAAQLWSAICAHQAGHPESADSLDAIRLMAEQVGRDVSRLSGVLRDGLVETDKYGGCNPSSPVWDAARTVLG